MKSTIIFLCTVILPLLIIAAGICISARQAAAADEREKSADDYPVRP